MLEKIKEPQYIVVSVVVVLTFILDLIAYFFKTSLEHDLLVMILTTFNGQGFITCINYAIGSSAGSKEKDQHIQELTKKENP